VSRFVYRFETALRAATLAARVAAGAIADARAALAALESAPAVADPRGRFDPVRAAPGGVRDLESLALHAIRMARARVAESARLRNALLLAHAAFDRADSRRRVLERHRELGRVRAAAARECREEREREGLEVVRRAP
jgi:hypothetical protein